MRSIEDHALRSRLRFILAMSLALGCGGGGDDDGTDDPPLEADATFSVSGTVYDLETNLPLEGSATLVTDGLMPPPSVSVSGAGFTIEVPANSTFHLLAGSPPTYRSTYNAAVEVQDEDVADLKLYALSEDYLARLASDFGVTATAGTGIIVLRAVDAQGGGFAGLPATAFELPANVLGPYFLDADLAADPLAEQTSTAGFAVFFDVPPGLTALSASAQAEYTIAMPSSPVAATTVSYAEAVVTDGAIEVPVGVSFANDVAPIFISRGCQNCHDGGGPGKDLGGLHLNGAANRMYRELVEEVSANHGIARVDLENPANSLMLTMPSFEDPPDVHPFATFLGPTDPDYLTLLVWIQEGALNN